MKSNVNGVTWWLCIGVAIIGVFQVNNVYAFVNIAELLARAAKDQAASLEVLKPGAIVAIKSHKNGRFLQVHGNTLKATGANKDDKSCQFEVDRQVNWVGFKYNGNYLQSVSAWEDNRHTVRFENKNFKDPAHTWEHWGFKGNLSGCYLQNQANGGHLSVRDGDVVTTHDHRAEEKVVGTRKERVGWLFFSREVEVPVIKNFKAPAGPHGWEHFSIEVVKTYEQIVFEREQEAAQARMQELDKAYAALKAQQTKEDEFKKKDLEEKIKKEKEEQAKLELERKGSAPDVKDSPALQKLKQGIVVALKVVGPHDTGMYLQVEAGKYLVSTAKDSKDRDTHLIVLRKGNWIGFKSYRAAGNNLQASAGSHEVSFVNKNFDADDHIQSHWALIPDKPESLDVVWLHNQGSGGFLTVPEEEWDANKVWTRRDSLGRAAIKDDESKFAIEIIQEVNDDFKPGKAKLTYAPELEKDPALFSDAWKFALKNTGWATFKVRALESVYIALSGEPAFDANNHYAIVFGHAGNSCSLVKKNGKDQVTINSAKLAGGLPGDGTQFEQCWISWNGKKGIISFGVGEKVGENASISWRDPEPLKDIQFVGFGSTIRAEFDAIAFSPAPPPIPDVIAPVGFEKIEGKLDRVAVGRRKNSLVAWGIGPDGALHEWQKNKWVKQVAKDQENKEIVKFEDVALGADGTLYAAAIDGKVYQYIWPDAQAAFFPIPGEGPKAPEKPVDATQKIDPKAIEKAVNQEQGKRKVRKQARRKNRIKKLEARVKKLESSLKSAKPAKKKKLERQLARLKKKLEKAQKNLKKKVSGSKQKKKSAKKVERKGASYG